MLFFRTQFSLDSEVHAVAASVADELVVEALLSVFSLEHIEPIFFEQNPLLQ